MSQKSSSPQSLSPSLQGSRSVAEVLGRIQVRDPSHKPSGAFGRRMSDYESPSPTLQATVLFLLAALVTGGLMTLSLQKMAQTWEIRPWTSTSEPAVEAIPNVQESLSISKEIHPLPQNIRRPPGLESPNVLPTPENLRTHFLGPRLIEFQWDSIGNGYVYRLFTASNPSFDDAQPATSAPIQSPHMAWMPDDGMRIFWVAVKAIDPQGRETGFSRPVLVQLPS